ncbi:MAG: UDP-N-acetylglucosamine 2-epimerase [Bacteroidota bacterium]|jgi:GDP/UDP-N,N'-diacetylbacillosamine 2-epimerase (hydrolysing)
MRVAVLTSSRADFGIYMPLLVELRDDPFFCLEIIVFGTHLSEIHGYTINDIISSGFEASHLLETVPRCDSPEAIASSIGETIKKFSLFWKEHKSNFDLIFCLGDRYEMFASVIAGIPFQLKFAHIHGGEITLGAIDNILRHSITLASKVHFAATYASAEVIGKLTGHNKHIFNVGSLSLDNIEKLKLLSLDEFCYKWKIDLSIPTILTTFHPETVNFESNGEYAENLIASIHKLDTYQFLVTMPNADTSSQIIRERFIQEFNDSKRVVLVENLGAVSYFSAMKFCKLLLGNTSSGIIEAASFGKYVINLGDRQKGREYGPNVFHIPIICDQIVNAVKRIEKSANPGRNNLYYNGGAANQIVKILKTIQSEI